MKKAAIISLVILFAFSGLLFAEGKKEAEEVKKGTVTVKVATSPPYTEGSPMVEFAVKFQELAGQYSEGRINIQIFWGGQLGTEQKVVKDAQSGVIPVAIVNIANVAPFSNSLHAVTLPYLFDSREQAHNLFLGELGDYFEEQTLNTAGLRVLAWPDQGFRVLHNTQKPVETPKDAKGLKWRVPNNPVFINMYKAWGLNPIPMAWGEVFSSLQTGVIHGGDNVLRNLIDFKMYQFEKYVTLTHHMLEIVPVIVSEQWFQNQDKVVQDILKRAASEAWEWEYNAMGKDIKATRERLRNKGMVIKDAKNMSEWRQAKDIWPNFYEKMGGKKVLDRILSFIEETQ